MELINEITFEMITATLVIIIMGTVTLFIGASIVMMNHGIDPEKSNSGNLLMKIGFVMMVVGVVSLLIVSHFNDIESEQNTKMIKELSCKELISLKDVNQGVVTNSYYQDLIKSEFVNGCVEELQWWEK